jgi:hypothetical protein
MILLGRKRYSFKDEFSTVKSTGAINSTSCESGPGTRTIVDTETCLSILPNCSSSLATQTGVTFGGSNNRCSYADGYAWMDFPTGFNAALHAGLGRIVVMYDSNGRAAWGYLGAAGSGESLGSELLTSWANNSDPADYETFTASGLDITSAINTDAVTASVKCIIPVGEGILTKFSVGTFTLNSGTAPFMRHGGNSAGTPVGEDTITSTNAYIFKCSTITNAYAVFRNTSTVGNWAVANTSVKQVTTPSSTGCYIYKTLDAAQAGNTAASGWNKPTAFDMNNAAYTFNIYQPTSGGKLFFMGGKATAAYGDPGYWKSEAITREAGKIVAFKVNITDVSKIITIGLDNSKENSTNQHSFQLYNGIKCYCNFVISPLVHNLSNSVDCVLAIILRTSGASFFVKYNNGYWKWVWTHAADISSTFYIGIGSYNVSGTVDFIRTPRTKWLPTPLLSDSFAAADATSNNNRTSDGLGHLETTGLGSGGSGAVWSGVSGAIQSNRLVITPTLGSELSSGSTSVGSWYKVTATTSNYFGTGVLVDHVFRATTTKTIDANNKVKLVTFSSGWNYVSQSSTDIEITTKFQRITGTQAGIVIGLNDAGTSFILAYHDGVGNVKVEICESGTYTTKATTAIAYSADAELRLSRRTLSNGTSEIWCHYNNTIVGTGPATTLSAGEAINLSGLKVGLFSTYEGNSFNDCSIYSVGTNNEYSMLERLVG